MHTGKPQLAAISVLLRRPGWATALERVAVFWPPLSDLKKTVRPAESWARYWRSPQVDTARCVS